MKILYDDLNRFTNSENNGSFELIKYFFISKGFRSVLFFRILNYLDKKNNLISLKYFLLILRNFLINIEISYKANIGPGMLIPHSQGIVIGTCTMGKNVTIQQGVTIGANIEKIKDGKKYPTIGNNVLVGAGAKILGPIYIGDNSIIGANAVVVEDIPADSIVVGIPGKVIGEVKEPYPEMLKRIYQE